MKLHTPYRERIQYYCETHGIEVPKNFDTTQSSESIVAVDLKAEPARLLPRSTHQWKEILKYIESAELPVENTKILDFKRGCELLLENGRLVRGLNFDKHHPKETHNENET